MNAPRIASWCIVCAVSALGTSIGLKKVIAAEPRPADFQDEVQVLTRGPVHEAFAETVTFDPEPGIVVPKAPPAAIEEMPPDQRPEGTNVAWIPGYSAWDDERTDFLWVSGIWRDIPPGRQWVPGYWGESGQGFQWTSGYWADEAVNEIQYLPEPPATVEAGPNIAAPSPDYIWSPGCWVWNQNRYAWRPGYWAAAQPDWTWVPAHYVWAPRGYVFIEGYYDYSIERRGVLFAPVYFNASVYSRQGFYYSPATVINPAVFVSQLFLRPQYQHYYFGDYYAANYSSAGFHPWFSYNTSRYGYDPIYAQQLWHHRQDRNWERNVQADFQHRRDHEDARPPRTWAAQRALMSREASSNQKSFADAAPLDQLTTRKDSPLRFQAVDQEERQRLAKRGQDIQKFRQERQQLENRAVAPTVDPAKQAESVRGKLPRSPIFAKSSGELGKHGGPPQVHVAPQPDPMFEPKPRGARSSTQPRPYTTNRRPVETTRPQPDAQPLPQPNVSRSPQSQPQPKPKVNRSERSQPQPKVNRPAPQSPPQPSLNRPAPQPTGKPTALPGGSAGPPSADPQSDKRSDKGKQSNSNEKDGR